MYSDIPFEPCDKPDQFPVALYGTNFRDAQKAWRRVQIRAEKSGSWSEALHEEECVSLYDRTAPILMRRPPLNSQCPYWHVYWIGETLFDRFNDKLQETIDRLTLLGLNYLWFAFGVMSSNWYSGGKMQRSSRFLYEMLCRYVYWIPELRKYGKLCTEDSGSPFAGKPPASEPYRWQRQLVLLAHDTYTDLWDNTGWKRLSRSFYISTTEPRDWEESDIQLMSSPDFEPIDGVEVLVRGGLIEERDGRYQVIHPPPDD
ncbi:MAG: hypothetical protein Tsb009_36290 [Planctomycetaceae bacterium]